MPNYKKVVVDNKILPYINNKTLSASGFFSRERNQNHHFLNALPVEVLRLILDKLSAKDLKALTETASQFIKEMMTPLSKEVDKAGYSVDFYPYLQEIYLSDFVHNLQKKGVYDELINRFLKKSDEGIEQALSRIIQFDHQTIKSGVDFYKREALITFVSGVQLDENGQLMRTSQVVILRAAPLVVLGLIATCTGLSLDPTTPMGPLLAYVGCAMFITGLSSPLALAILALFISRKKDPFETIESNQNETTDTIENATDHTFRINIDERSETEDDEDDDLLWLRPPARPVFSDDDNDDRPSETSPLLRR